MLDHRKRVAAKRIRCALNRPNWPRDKGRLATSQVSMETSTPNNADKHPRSDVSCWKANSRVAESGKALNKKFARVDAQKSRINQAHCRSGLERIRSNRVWWEANFDCKCLRTKSACPNGVPRMTTPWSYVGMFSSPLHLVVAVGALSHSSSCWRSHRNVIAC